MIIWRIRIYDTKYKEISMSLCSLVFEEHMN